uniref:Uncharacterized protein n=1 Tax=Grammatophora oceanica TaxID=210454 RepID=A0A7S1VWE2_9STRA|mmetsp:Transcript_9698/g.14295  ORF Transcript_9698/g.14295 Transcript_9698/m.14295 type:complete len:438 (+) Transcript_9698:98-1411(+)
MEKELFQAAKEGNLKEFQRLVESGEANPTIIRSNHYDMTALHCACYRGSLSIVQYLIEYYLEKQEQRPEEQEEEDVINIGDCYGITPLHYAASCRSSEHRLPMVKMLIEQGHANVEATDDRHETALHAACRKCHLDVVQYLVEQAKANVNAGLDSEKPLHIALQRRQSRENRNQTVSYLIPICTMDAKGLELAWKHFFSWDIKCMMLTRFQEQQDKDTLATTSSVLTLHSILKCPLPSVDALMECLEHYESDLRRLDHQGRLPLHVALEEVTTQNDSSSSILSPFVISELFHLEPRAAIVKDPTTGFYPFEAATACGEGDDEEWLTVSFEMLLQLDPETWMRSRGIGDCTIEDDPSRCLPGRRSRRPTSWFVVLPPFLLSSSSRGEKNNNSMELSDTSESSSSSAYDKEESMTASTPTMVSSLSSSLEASFASSFLS